MLPADEFSSHSLRFGALSITSGILCGTTKEPLRVASGRWRPQAGSLRRDGKLSLYSSRTGKHIRDYQVDSAQDAGTISTMAYNHNGTLLATGSADGMMRVFDTTRWGCRLLYVMSP